MNEKQVKNVLGLLTGIAFLVVVVRANWLGNTVPDRTVVIFALLLYAYLQVDISDAVPLIDLGGNDSAESGPEED